MAVDSITLFPFFVKLFKTLNTTPSIPTSYITDTETNIPGVTGGGGDGGIDGGKAGSGEGGGNGGGNNGGGGDGGGD